MKTYESAAKHQSHVASLELSVRILVVDCKVPVETVMSRIAWMQQIHTLTQSERKNLERLARRLTLRSVSRD